MLCPFSIIKRSLYASQTLRLPKICWRGERPTRAGRVAHKRDICALSRPISSVQQYPTPGLQIAGVKGK